MSDLSRLRARWERLEKRIQKLESDCAQLDDDEIPAMLEKIVAAKERLEETIRLTHAEELRLYEDATSKLRFTGV